MSRLSPLLIIVLLAGCGPGGPGFLDRIVGGPDAEAAPDTPAATGDPLRAPMRDGVPPPAEAATAEDFDTTTPEERAAAAATDETEGARRLGTTVASLGDPADPGFWIETPLVTEARRGRLEYPANGKTVQVELRPSGGASGSGSRVSLPALRMLEAPLTGLPELVVFAL
jgi:hypothetical protein